MPRRMQEFKQPEFPFKEIQPVLVHVRGTSTQYSRPGSARAMIGRPAGVRGTTDDYSFIEAYHIPARSPSHEEWRARAEATFHAAVERALDHSLMVGAGGVDSLLKPAHLPVLVFGVEPSYSFGPGWVKPFISLSEKVEPYREHYEWALVRGQPQQTFRETKLPLPDRTSDVHYFRVALTRQEYNKILREAMGRAKQAGHDLRGDIVRYLQKRNELANQINNAVGGERQESHWPPAAKELQAAMNRLDETGWDLVKDTIGHEKVGSLKETGQHASHAYTYYIGEHVKKLLLAKAYARLEKEFHKAWEPLQKRV